MNSQKSQLRKTIIKTSLGLMSWALIYPVHSDAALITRCPTLHEWNALQSDRSIIRSIRPDSSVGEAYAFEAQLRQSNEDFEKHGLAFVENILTCVYSSFAVVFSSLPPPAPDDGEPQRNGNWRQTAVVFAASR